MGKLFRECCYDPCRVIAGLSSKHASSSRYVSPHFGNLRLRHATCRVSRHFESPDPGVRMSFLGVPGKTVKRLVRLPTWHSLRRLQPKPARGGRPTIPVWRSHATSRDGVTGAEPRTRPSQSTRTVRDPTPSESATVNTCKKRTKNHGSLPVRLLTGGGHIPVTRPSYSRDIYRLKNTASGTPSSFVR